MKKHIVTIGYTSFALDSITAANSIMAALAKAQPVKFNYGGQRSASYYEPAPPEEYRYDFELKLNQNYREPKPEPKPKILALPKPKRGTILCICEKSCVAPRETCAHCGRSFTESHNRTHNTSQNHGENLRLI